MRRLAARLPDRAGEYVLNVYPALSLLGLLVLWLAGLMIGWSLVYWGLDQQLGGSADWGTLVYYAGTSLVTPVFGSAHGALVRMLTLLETLTGVVTIALMISYLPALYGAYSRREARLLTLDDPLGCADHAGAGRRAQRAGRRLEMLYRVARRVADVDRRRAREPRVVPDAGALPVPASRPVVGHGARRGDRRRHARPRPAWRGPASREPYFLYRRGRRAIIEISSRLHVPRARDAADVAGRGELRAGLAPAGELGSPCATRPRPGRTCRTLRATYGDQLERLIDFLVAPRGFWGHSAEADGGGTRWRRRPARPGGGPEVTDRTGGSGHSCRCCTAGGHTVTLRG